MAPIGIGLGLKLGGLLAGGGGRQLELDGLTNLYAIHALKRVLSSYPKSSPIVRIRENSGNTEQDFAAGSDDWVSAAEITAFLNGATGFVVRLYDQTGNSRHAEQATAGSQPSIDLSGAHPVVVYSSQPLLVQSASAFARNAGSASTFIVRQHTTTTGTRLALLVSTGSATGSRLSLGIVGAHVAFGRRLDNDSGQSTTSTGFTANANWGVQVARADWTNARLHHTLDAVDTTLDPFQTAGSTSDIASAGIAYGGATGGFFLGKMTAGGLVSGLMSDADKSALVLALASLKL